MKNTTRMSVAMGASALLAVGSIGSVSAQDELTPIDLQLQWVSQAQFGGFFAAKDLGFYEDVGLDVSIVETPIGATPPQTAGSEPTGPEFVIAWVPRVLEVRESETQSDLVNIAQHFQNSGTLSVSWADAPVPSPADFAGKKVGMWDFGNDFEVIAAARAQQLEAGIDYERVIQAFDMNAFLNREIDVAEAMTYNEYAQVLETENPETGELYQPEDLVVIDYNEEGFSMLQDAVWARESWLAEDGNEDIATRFLAATFRGWQHCRDNPADCVDIVTANGSILGAGHQAWMMNEINSLIWPSPDGIGALPVETWDRTVQIMLDSGIIANDPGDGAYRTDLADAARAMIDGDVTGEDFEKAVVEITPRGE